jgi:hypothetical protein
MPMIAIFPDMLKNTAMRGRNLHAIGFAVLVALLLLERALCFTGLNAKFSDSDQTLMWLGARDYSQGHFPEPRFYGQDYNTFFESLVAAPLLWLDVPVYHAVPLATHFIFLFPFLFGASWMFSRGNRNGAIILLATLLCMPVSFDVMTSLSRGFVTGLFFCSFFAMSLHDPRRQGYILLNTVMAVAGYFVNPNSVIVSVPLLLYLFLMNTRQKRYYVTTAAGLMSAVPFYFLFDHFYARNPEYVILPLQNKLHATHFIENLLNLPNALRHVSPFTDAAPIGFVLVLLLLFYFSKKYNRASLAATGMLLVVVLASCFSEKMAEGSDWAFYSFGRIYLGAPLLLALLSATIPFKAIAMRLIVLVTFIFTAYKTVTYPYGLSEQLDKSKQVCVAIIGIPEVLNVSQFYKQVCVNNRLGDILVSNGFWMSTVIAYGGPAIDRSYPATYVSTGDRRHLVRQKARTMVKRSFLLISSRSDIKSRLKGPFTLARLDDYGMYRVEGNQLAMAQFAELVNEAENAR